MKIFDFMDIIKDGMKRRIINLSFFIFFFVHLNTMIILLLHFHLPSFIFPPLFIYYENFK